MKTQPAGFVPTTYEQMITQTADVLARAQLLKEGTRLANVPQIVADLIDRMHEAQQIDSANAIHHLQDKLAGCGAALVIDDTANRVVIEYLGREIPCAPDEFITALDAITTLQNLIEGGE